MFVSAIASRRVSVYPKNWRALSDSELEELSWRTSDIPTVGIRLMAASRRYLHASDDRIWIVEEMDARHVPGAKAERCLVFSTGSITRRVWEYPANWMALPDAELQALSRGV